MKDTVEGHNQHPAFAVEDKDHATARQLSEVTQDLCQGAKGVPLIVFELIEFVAGRQCQVGAFHRTECSSGLYRYVVPCRDIDPTLLQLLCVLRPSVASVVHRVAVSNSSALPS